MEDYNICLNYRYFIDEFDEDFYEAVVEDFIKESYDEKYNTICDCYKERNDKNCNELKRMVHTLKSNSKYYDEQNFAKDCQEMEDLAANMNWDKLEERKDKYLTNLNLFYLAVLHLYKIICKNKNETIKSEYINKVSVDRHQLRRVKLYGEDKTLEDELFNHTDKNNTKCFDELTFKNSFNGADKIQSKSNELVNNNNLNNIEKEKDINNNNNQILITNEYNKTSKSVSDSSSVDNDNDIYISNKKVNKEKRMSILNTLENNIIGEDDENDINLLSTNSLKNLSSTKVVNNFSPKNNDLKLSNLNSIKSILNSDVSKYKKTKNNNLTLTNQINYTDKLSNFINLLKSLKEKISNVNLIKDNSESLIIQDVFKKISNELLKLNLYLILTDVNLLLSYMSSINDILSHINNELFIKFINTIEIECISILDTINIDEMNINRISKNTNKISNLSTKVSTDTNINNTINKKSIYENNIDSIKHTTFNKDKENLKNTTSTYFKKSPIVDKCITFNNNLSASPIIKKKVDYNEYLNYLNKSNIEAIFESPILDNSTVENQIKFIKENNCLTKPIVGKDRADKRRKSIVPSKLHNSKTKNSFFILDNSVEQEVFPFKQEKFSCIIY